jgi:hypothetical protein
MLVGAGCSEKSNHRHGDPAPATAPDSDDGDASSLPDSKKPTTTADVLNFQADTGIKSGTQIFNTMLAVTGVAESAMVPNGRANEPLKTVFERDLLSAMPLESKIQSFGAGNQSAIIKLAIMVCHSMVENATLSAAFFPGVDLSQAPAAFTGKEAVAKALVDKFWGPVDIGMDKKQAAADLVTLETSLISGLPGDTAGSAQGTKNVVKGTCAAAAASLPGILL